MPFIEFPEIINLLMRVYILWPVFPQLLHFSSLLVTTILISISTNSPFLDFTCKWYHEVIVILFLIYLTKHNTFKGHPCCCHKWHDFLLSNIGIIFLLCVDSTSSLCIHPTTSDSNLGCFHVLAIVKMLQWIWHADSSSIFCCHFFWLSQKLDCWII